MKLIRHGRKALLAGVALAACMGFAVNAQAQTCTVDNWEGGATGLTDANAGTQGADNRRYGGPCALRVPVDGMARYVSDDSPSAEGSYIARFYAFLNDAGSDPVQIFAADDGATDQIQVWYNEAAPGDLTLRVYGADSSPNDLTFNGVSSGWHSIEFAWSADAAAEIAFSVDGAADMTATVDTSGLAIANAQQDPRHARDIAEQSGYLKGLGAGYALAGKGIALADAIELYLSSQGLTDQQPVTEG